jgi:hypothetical protein
MTQVMSRAWRHATPKLHTPHLGEIDSMAKKKATKKKATRKAARKGKRRAKKA